MQTLIKLNPCQVILLTQLIAYRVGQNILNYLNQATISEVQMKTPTILSLWGFDWSLSMNNQRHTKYFNCEELPGVTLIRCGGNHRIEIDQLVGPYNIFKPLKTPKLSNKVIGKLKSSGLMQKYPDLINSLS